MKECQTVPTTWTGTDLDFVVQYEIDKKLGIESVDELSRKP